MMVRIVMGRERVAILVHPSVFIIARFMLDCISTICRSQAVR